MSKWLVAICAVLAIGLIAVGCGDDDEEPAGNGATVEQTTPTEAEQPGDGAEGGDAAGDGERVEVEVVDIDYDPRDVTVEEGTTIEWTNTGNLPHTVTKTDGPGDDFDSGNLASGDTFEHTFDAAGTIDYVCTIHPNQRGTVTVE